MHDTTLFIGVGSPHGDDHAGWLVADALSDHADPRRSTARADTSAGCGKIAIHKICTPADLFDWLDGAANLTICDAVCGPGPAGTLHRWIWPDGQIGRLHSAGSHDFGLSEVLEMAGELGRLPHQVIVWGIEAGRVRPDAGLSPEVQQALPDLVERIRSDLRHA